MASNPKVAAIYCLNDSMAVGASQAIIQAGRDPLKDPVLVGFNGDMVALHSTIGVGAEFTAIATAVVGGTSLAGGRGNLFGTCCAALLLATIKTGLNVVNVSSLYEDLVFGSILIVALMIDGRRRAVHGKGMIVV